jgi:hypothetical protein
LERGDAERSVVSPATSAIRPINVAGLMLSARAIASRVARVGDRRLRSRRLT